MLLKKEISKDHRLNDIVFELQEGIPALDGYTGEEGSGIKVVIHPFLFSAPYRVGEQVLLARPERFGGIIFFEGMFQYDQVSAMTIDRIKRYTLQYIRFNEFLNDSGNEKYRDPHSRVEFLEITPAIYDTPQPALNGGLPLNAFEVKGRLTRSQLEQKL